MVRDFWKSYVSCYQNESDKSHLAYWNLEELGKGFSDIVVSATPFRSYKNSEILVSGIRMADNGIFEIKNTLTLGNSFKYFTTIFKIYVKKDPAGFKLYNSFHINKPLLHHFQTNNIDYYYSDKFKFDSLKAGNSEEFYSDLIRRFGKQNERRVTYITGNNLDEAYQNLGVDSTTFSSNSKYAGYHISDQNVILSCREDHFHELAHTVFGKFNNIGILQEGVATYFGGTNGLSFKDNVYKLKESIRNKPELDLSDIDNLDNALGNTSINNYYIIGSVFVDYALKNGGDKRLLELLQYKDHTNSDFDGAGAAIENVLGIKKDHINRFLKDYIKNFR